MLENLNLWVTLINGVLTLIIIVWGIITIRAKANADCIDNQQREIQNLKERVTIVEAHDCKDELLRLSERFEQMAKVVYETNGTIKSLVASINKGGNKV